MTPETGDIPDSNPWKCLLALAAKAEPLRPSSSPSSWISNGILEGPQVLP
eukprot:CAMPEP_0181344634 /NCGR_PEP_ID=MMETSP1101-20121128/32279_1 /TAXON_ID=46948 /ORGANISM="Rhodomonas abbreviata, Strain Caron Lab Isolate" /LENGTH=49 /DNA_ID= /DNA_START= /DNA_END= /DNA_ORIENTATION=